MAQRQGLAEPIFDAFKDLKTAGKFTFHKEMGVVGARILGNWCNMMHEFTCQEQESAIKEGYEQMCTVKKEFAEAIKEHDEQMCTIQKEFEKTCSYDDNSRESIQIRQIQGMMEKSCFFNHRIEEQLSLILRMVDDDIIGAEDDFLHQACVKADIQQEKEKINTVIEGLRANCLDERHNRTYGPGATYWEGALKDSHDRGPGFQYFCPNGWTRYGLKVEHPERMEGWNIVYHGTSQKNALGILENGMAKSRCDNGVVGHEPKAYFTPCVEYAAHPRYAKILKKTIQVVLQVRVRPEAVQEPRTNATLLGFKQDTIIDSRYDNESMEWITKVGPDNIIMYGLMVRKVENPSALPSSKWWTACHSQFGQPPDFGS